MLSSGNSRVFQLPWAPPGRAHRPSLLSENAINTISPWGYGVCYFFFPFPPSLPWGRVPQKVKVKSLSRVRLFAIPWTVAYQALRPWDFPGKSTGMGCLFLLQGIFPTQGSNPSLQHCRQTLYHLRQLEEGFLKKEAGTRTGPGFNLWSGN